MKDERLFDMRYVMVWIPNWPVNSLVVDIPPGTHGAIETGGYIRVVTPPARKCGVRQGMKVSMARYLCPDLLVLPFDMRREFSSFEVILRACEQWIARIACIYPGLAWAPAAGAARWSGGEAQLAENLVDAISDCTGSESNVGIASGPLASYGAARRGIILAPEDTQDFLDQLEVHQCLSLFPPKQQSALSQFVQTCHSAGITRGIDIRKMGSAALYSRFGSIGKQVWELFTGKDLWLPERQILLDDLQVEEECEESLEREEQVTFCARRLAHQICEKLDSRGLRCSSIAVSAQDSASKSYERQWWGIDGEEDEIADRIRWQLVAWLSASESEQGFVRVNVRAEHCERVGASRALWRAGESSQRDSVLRKICAYKGENAIRIPRIIPGYSPTQRAGFASVDERKEKEQVTCLEGGIEDAPSRLCVHPYPAEVYGKIEGFRKVDVRVNGRSALTSSPQEVKVCAFGEEYRYHVLSWHGPWAVPQQWWSEPAEDMSHDPQTHYLRVKSDSSPDLLLMWNHHGWSLVGIYECEASFECGLS